MDFGDALKGKFFEPENMFGETPEFGFFRNEADEPAFARNGEQVGRFPLRINDIPGHPVMVTGYGAVGDLSTDDTQAFLDAVAAAKTNGGGPVVVPAGNYKITDEIVLDLDYLALIVQSGASIYQYTYGLSCVQIRADYVTVTGGGRLVNPITKTEIVGSGASGYEGNPARSRSAGVYMIGANNCTVSDLTIENFVCAVPFYQINDAPTRLSTNCANNRIQRIHAIHFDFAFVGANQRNLLISDCTGYLTDRSQGDVDPTDPDYDNGPAPHLLYLSGNPSKNKKSQSITIANCLDYFNPFSSSYKAKNVDGLLMTDVQSLAAQRGIDLDVQKFSIVNPVIIDSLGQPGINCNANCANGQIVNPFIYINEDLSAYTDLFAAALPAVTPPSASDINLIKAITFENTCSNIAVRGGKLSHSNTSNESMVLLGGNNVQIIDTEFIQRGSNAFPTAIRSGSVDCKVIRPNIRFGSTFTVTAGAYDPVTGLVTFTTAETIRFQNGTPITISGMTGTGDFATLNGERTAIDPITSNTFTVQRPTSLTMTLTGGTVVSGGFRICEIKGATLPVRTVVEVDPYVLNFELQINSITDDATDSIIRYMNGRLRAAPASSSAPGKIGDTAQDATYIYICTELNTWKRIAHSAF